MRAVADVADDDVGVVNVDGLGGAAHAAFALAGSLGRGQDFAIGVAQGGLQGFLVDSGLVGAGRRWQVLARQAAEHGLLQKELAHLGDGQGGRDFARFVAPHAVAQQDHGIFVDVVLPAFHSVQEGEGVLVAGAHHAGRGPGGDVETDAVESAATGFQGAGKLEQAARIGTFHFVRWEAKVRLAYEGFVDQARNERMHVGIAIGDLVGGELPFKVFFLQAVMEIFQGIKRGAETVQHGPAIGIFLVENQLRSRVQRGANRGAGGKRHRQKIADVRDAGLAGVRYDDGVGPNGFEYGPGLEQGEQGIGRLLQPAVADVGEGFGLVPGVPQAAALGSFLDEIFRVVLDEVFDHFGQAGMLGLFEHGLFPGQAGERAGGILGFHLGGGHHDVVEGRQDLLFGGGDRLVFGQKQQVGPRRDDDDNRRRRSFAVSKVEALMTANAETLADHVVYFVTILDANLAGGRHGRCWFG